MARIRETVYDGRDNVISLVILENDEPVSDLSGLTRVVLTVEDQVIDSAVAGSDVIWWTDQDDYEGAPVDVLKLRLGHESIPLGTYTGVCLVLFDSVATSGIVYSNTIQLDVVAGCSVG